MRLAHASATLLMAGSLSLSAWMSLHEPLCLGQPLPAATPAIIPARDDAAARKAEIDIELAWLGDPSVFPCQLSVHCRGPLIEISGIVPDDSIRNRAIALAQKHSHLPIEDRLIVQAGSALPVLACNRDMLCRTAITRLARHLGQNGLPWEVTADATGQIIVTGSIPSLEEKLDVSRRMSQLPGCSAVVNHLLVKPLMKEGRAYSPVTADQTLILLDRPVATAVSTKPASHLGQKPLPQPVVARSQPVLASPQVDDDSYSSPYAQAINQPKPISAQPTTQPAKTSQWMPVAASSTAKATPPPASGKTIQWMPVAASSSTSTQPTAAAKTSQWMPVAANSPAVPAQVAAPVATGQRSLVVGERPAATSSQVAPAKTSQRSLVVGQRPAATANPATPATTSQWMPTPNPRSTAMASSATRTVWGPTPSVPPITIPPASQAKVATPPPPAGTSSRQRLDSAPATAAMPPASTRPADAGDGGILVKALRSLASNRAEADTPVMAASHQQPVAAKPNVVPVNYQPPAAPPNPQPALAGYQPMPRGPEQQAKPLPQVSLVTQQAPSMPPAAPSKPPEYLPASPYATRRVEERPVRSSTVQPAAATQPASVAAMPQAVATPASRPLPPTSTSGVAPAVATRQQPAELTQAFLGQLRNRILQVCHGRVHDVQVRKVGTDRLQISMKAASAEEGQRYGSMVLALSELVPYQVDLTVALDK